jgi:streptomycin 6-kinase
MLKISHHPEEAQGGHLMAWWNGAGAARVFAHHDTAILLERATGPRSLAEMSRTGSDSEASRILCAAAATLHGIDRPSPPRLTPLTEWFRELQPVARHHGGIFGESLRASQALLSTPRDTVILHGDLHHGNVLDAGVRGWLAIDPKGLVGERGFEFANVFCNPDKEIATTLGRFAMQSTVVAEAAHIKRARLLQWILAYAGLSAAWSLNSSDNPELALAVAQAAAAELRKS